MSAFSYRVLIVPVIASFLFSFGCSSRSPATKSGNQPLSSTDEQIFIGDTVEKNYDPNVIMKRAESFFEKEDYPEAIIEYQHFLDLHRAHMLAPYAQYKLAESHYKQIKTIDRDTDPIYKALEAFEKLRRDFPGSRYDAEALERIQSCHRYIAETYLFVGRFYYRREAYLAAAHRFEAILKHYPDMDIAGDALYHLALTYKEMGADDWAREKLLAFVERYPHSENAEPGRKLLAKLSPKSSDTLARNASPADASTPGPVSLHAGAVQDALGAANSAPSGSLGVVPDQAPMTTLCRLGLWC